MKSVKVLGVLFLIVCASSGGMYKPQYLKTFACEKNLLTVKCPPGYSISLIRANYGRFSLSVCNEHGVSDWSVNCMSSRSFRVIQDRCGDKNNCSIKADSKIFGDPCSKTLKYLEVHYMCIPNAFPIWPTTKTTATSDWEIEIQSGDSDRKKANISKVAENTFDHPTITEEWIAAVTKKEIIANHTPTTTIHSIITSPEKRKDFYQEYCQPIIQRDIEWNYTKRGETVVVQCPTGMLGFAKWKCDYDLLQWTPNNPDLSECKSTWISSLNERLDYDESIINVAAELARVTRRKSLYGGDLVMAAHIVNKVTSQVESRLKSLIVINKADVISELLHCVVETTSNLLDKQRWAAWNDLTKSLRVEIANSLMESVKNNAFTLADQINSDKLLIQEEKNIMINMKISRSQNVHDLSFSTIERFDDDEVKTAEFVTVSADSQLSFSDGEFVKVIFLALRNVENILKFANGVRHSQSSENNDNNEKQLFINVTSQSSMLNSRVISLFINQNKKFTFRRPVTITLQHLDKQKNFQAIPLSWNYKTNSWSDTNCKVITSNSTHTTFFCTEPSSYALATVPLSTKISTASATIPKINSDMVVKVGCIVCIIFLALSMLLFAIFHRTKNNQFTIQKNIALCLLLSELIFLIGIKQTSERVLCGIIAGTLQYFLLCTFLWLFLEIFYVYQMLICKTNQYPIRWCFLLAFGVPGIIVVTSILINPSSYGTADFCWLQIENYFFLSLMGPVATVVVVSLLVLGIISCTICFNKTEPTILKSNARVLALKSVFLLTILTLTWVCAVLYLMLQENTITSYAYAVLNSTLGIYIFFFYCVQNEDMKLQYRKFNLVNCLKFNLTTNDNLSLPDSESSRQNCFTRLALTPSEKSNSVTRLPTVSDNLDSSFVKSGKSAVKSLTSGTVNNEQPIANYGGFSTVLSTISQNLDKNEHTTDWHTRSKFKRNDSEPESSLVNHQFHNHSVSSPAEHVYMDIDNKTEEAFEQFYDEIELKETDSTFFSPQRDSSEQIKLQVRTTNHPCNNQSNLSSTPCAHNQSRNNRESSICKQIPNIKKFDSNSDCEKHSSDSTIFNSNVKTYDNAQKSHTCFKNLSSETKQ